jgi:lipopolysaccharide/colanic/teichoic acid biosynthesis glycosyltransferase
MSLIGPRPTLPEQVVHYSERQGGRLAIRPGITGWAQMNGRNSISWPERSSSTCGTSRIAPLPWT